MSERDPQSSKNLRRALERTAPSEDFSAEALRREADGTPVLDPPDLTTGQFLRKTLTDATAGETADPTRTSTLTSFGDSEAVLPGVLAEDESGRRRFEVQREVGRGATSRVYAVRDNSLGRTIAVKLLRQSREKRASVRERFLHEARVTATLEHPNIMPIHDIGVGANHELYFTMKNIAGMSLGDAIRRKQQGQPTHEELAGVDGVVRVFLKVCDALSFAHSRGYVHQDVKPDNIMVGEHGEVLLLDWGSALSREEVASASGKALYGTPAYMSPEQARRERADERSDIYCLGATFFHALLLRHPTWSDAPEEFWAKKRKGTLDLPTEEERRRVPAALVDIALKAMQSDSVRRYQTVDELSAELKRWQAGQAVRAHRESLLEKFIRWYRRNRRLFWVGAVSTALVLGAATVLFREKLRELVTWRLLYETSFTGAALTQIADSWQGYVSYNWADMAPDSGVNGEYWSIDSGRLVGQAVPALINLAFTRPVPGDIRVEWDVTPLGQGDNINCFVGGSTRFHGYTFHVGGFGDFSSVTLTRGRTMETLFRAPMGFSLVSGRTYRFRMEREDRSIRLYIDGRRVVEYRDLDVLAGPGHQSFGFEVNNGNRVAYDNIRVYHHPLALKVSPVATPDDYREQGNLDRARVLYAEIARIYEGTDDAAEALFKYARCLSDQDSTLAALGAFRRFEGRYPRHEMVPLSMYERSRIHRSMGDTAGVFAIYEELAYRHRGHPVLKAALFDLSSSARAVLDSVTPLVGMTAQSPEILRRLDGHRKLIQHWGTRFGVDLSDDTFLQALLALLGSDRVGILPDSLLTLFPDLRSAVAATATKIAATEWVLAQFADIPNVTLGALREAACWEEILSRFPDDSRACAEALARLGRYREVLERYPRERPWVSHSLLRTGEYERVLREYPDRATDCAIALFRLGRYEECLRRAPADTLYGLASAVLSGKTRQLVEMLGDNADARALLYMDLGWYRRTVELFRDLGVEAALTGVHNYPGALVELGCYDEARAAARLPFVVNYTLVVSGKQDSAIGVYAGNREIEKYLACAWRLRIAGRPACSAFGEHRGAVALRQGLGDSAAVPASTGSRRECAAELSGIPCRARPLSGSARPVRSRPGRAETVRRSLARLPGLLEGMQRRVACAGAVR